MEASRINLQPRINAKAADDMKKELEEKLKL